MNEVKQVFDTLYSTVKIGGIFFAIGIAWQLLKTLRENLVELKAFELQHRFETTKTTNGLGIASSLGTEVYSVVEIWKVA